MKITSPRLTCILSALTITGCLTPDYDFTESPTIIYTPADGGSGGGTPEPGDTSGGGSPAVSMTPMGGSVVATGGSPGGDGDGDASSGGSSTGSGGDASGGMTGMEPRSTECYGETPILFSDDFENGVDCWTQTTSGDWDLLSTGGYSDSSGFSQTTTSGFRILAVAGEPTWDNVRVQAYIKVLDWGSGILQDQVALIARYQDESNFYYVSMSALAGEEKLRLKKSESGITSQIGESHIISGGWQLDTWYQIAIEVNGSNLRGFINGVPRLNSHTDTAFSAGEIAVGTMSDATIVVDGVQVIQL